MQPCKGTAHDIADAHKSFPSGHASMSAAGFYFVALYVSGKVGALARKSHPGWATPLDVRLVQLGLGTLAVAFAVWVACTRLRDYRHDTADVTAGHILGALTAWAVHGCFYPTPADLKCAGLPLQAPSSLKVEDCDAQDTYGYHIDNHEIMDEERESPLRA